ncbi:MAG: NCS2 family permease [Eubacterium sp.]|nr:NCS2 family permease [Eubacterium sp.]
MLKGVLLVFEKLFKLKEHGTNEKTEILAGFTTFLAMAYILAVNPSILGNVMDANGVFLATALSSAIATFIMAFYANYPIALSAGMGLNAYFAFSVCLGDLAGEENAFRVALTAVLVEGIIFILMSFFKFREQIIVGIPNNLKYGITTGIGLFIAFIGLQGAGIAVTDSSTLVGLGDFNTPQVVLAIIGFLLIVILNKLNVKGAVLIGIIATWILGLLSEVVGWYIVDVDAGVYSLIPKFSWGISLKGLSATAFKFDFAWAGSHILSFISIVFSFLFVDLFDTVGTVIGVADKAGLLDEKGNLPKADRVFLADAVGTTVGACLGTSTVSSYVESSAGVVEGGRTGLTAFTTGILFMLSLFLSPIFLAIPSFATAPALIYVGMLMFPSVKKIDMEGDAADLASAFMAVIMMPLTYSIANGIMFGVITWVTVKLFTGKVKEINPIMWATYVIFILRMVALAKDFL